MRPATVFVLTLILLACFISVRKLRSSAPGESAGEKAEPVSESSGGSSPASLRRVGNLDRLLKKLERYQEVAAPFRARYRLGPKEPFEGGYAQAVLPLDLSGTISQGRAIEFWNLDQSIKSQISRLSSTDAWKLFEAEADLGRQLYSLATRLGKTEGLEGSHRLISGSRSPKPLLRYYLTSHLNRHPEDLDAALALLIDSDLSELCEEVAQSAYEAEARNHPRKTLETHLSTPSLSSLKIVREAGLSPKAAEVADLIEDQGFSTKVHFWHGWAAQDPDAADSWMQSLDSVPRGFSATSFRPMDPALCSRWLEANRMGQTPAVLRSSFILHPWSTLNFIARVQDPALKLRCYRELLNGHYFYSKLTQPIQISHFALFRRQVLADGSLSPSQRQKILKPVNVINWTD